MHLKYTRLLFSIWPELLHDKSAKENQSDIFFNHSNCFAFKRARNRIRYVWSTDLFR